MDEPDDANAGDANAGTDDNDNGGADDEYDNANNNNAAGVGEKTLTWLAMLLLTAPRTDVDDPADCSEPLLPLMITTVTLLVSTDALLGSCSKYEIHRAISLLRT